MVDEQHNHRRSVWPLVAMGTAGALIAAPYVLPLVGIGTAETTNQVMGAFHSHNAASPGSGLAGLISSGLSLLPGGTTLAAGGWGAVATSSILGIGGMLLANWMEKREGARDFHWSKVIRYGSLATSMLISLPAILTGICVGATFLASFFVSQASTFNAITGALGATLGSANMAVPTTGGSALTTLLPHLLSCGAGIIPVSMAYFMGGNKAPVSQIDVQSAVWENRQKPLHTAAHAL